MRFFWARLLVASLFFQSFAGVVFAFFEQGEMVELAQSVWGRTEDDFRSFVKNRIAIVPKKTRATILEKKHLESGNYGFKVRVESGKMAGKELWVYYNVKKPSLKLYVEPQKAKPNPKDETKNVKEAKVAIATKPISAIDAQPLVKQTPPDATDCVNPPTDETAPLKSLAEIEKKLGEIKGCPELSPGEAMQVDIDSQKSPTGVQHKYRLSRIDDKTFEVALNLQFDPEASFLKMKGISVREAQEKMRGIVQDCLNIVNPKFLGPNGKRLRVRLADGFERNPPPQVHIKVGETARQHSEFYSYETKCSTITHELLHLMGLVDEYKEKSIGYIRGDDGNYRYTEDVQDKAPPAYDCRVVGPKESIMNEQGEAWGAVFGKVKYITCDCGKDPECAAKLARWTDLNCPHSQDVSQRTETEIDYNGGPSFQTKVTGSRLEIFKSVTSRVDGELDSLLWPQHFMNIVNPGCESTNRDYYLCAKNAYASTNKPEQIYDKDTNSFLKDASGKYLYKITKSQCPVPPEKLPKSCTNGSTDWAEKIK